MTQKKSFSLTTAQLRDRFLTFFERRAHVRKPSDSLIPSDDPTVLFTSAGMNQFKPNFLGIKTDLKRAASCQKCLRTGDLDAVGDASHHSFFEMLGNFSFGDYFKEQAIGWAWEFLTGTTDYAGKLSPDSDTLCLALAKENLWVSIYEEDDEAFDLWRKLGVPESRIRRFGQGDNFWPANAPKEGPNGPCGPCSEIYFDAQGQVAGPKSVEIWNLVFTQFDRQSDGSLKPLPRKNIDTGMGLERLASVIQGVATDYDTDGFRPIMDAIRKLASGHSASLSDEAVQYAQRGIADHIRAIVFLIADGLSPSNEGRGYILRMMIRRMCLRAEKGLGIKALDPGLSTTIRGLAYVVGEVAHKESPYGQDLMPKSVLVQAVLKQEIEQFQLTLRSGMDRFEVIVQRLLASGQKTVQGEEAFLLYDTYGFPLEMTQELVRSRGLAVDKAGFEKSLEEQKERSRAGSQFGGSIFVGDTLRVREAIAGVPSKEQHFVGYEQVSVDGARILGLWTGKQWVNSVKAGQEVAIVLDRSPFYGESGGQVGDRGELAGDSGKALIEQTTWNDEALLHHARVTDGSLSVQQPVRARVDAQRRLQVARSHTATHMLHWALRNVLGPEAVQAGSYVEADRLRFDFSSTKPLHEDQRYQVEALVNARVRLADGVQTAQMRLAEAKQSGAVAMFGEKYSDHVRVVSIGDYSKELCGGTHLLHTGFVGTFKIASESSIASGTRRIEALVGASAAQEEQSQSRLLQEAAKRLGRPARELVAGIDDLLNQIKAHERERRVMQADLAVVQAERLKASGASINGAIYIAAKVDGVDREQLKILADAVRNSLSGEGVVLLVSHEGGQLAWVMAVTEKTAKRVHAGQVLKAVSALTQGSGGGRADFAQAGGRDVARIPEALKQAELLVRSALEKTGT